MRVKECMCNNVIYTNPGDTLENVAKLMNENHIGCIPVCEEAGNVVGFVTDRDIILRGVACGKNCANTKVSEIMTTQVIKTTPDTEINSVTQTMSDNQIRRLPVIQDGKVVGILTLSDIAKNDGISKENLGNTMECICGCNKKNDR